MTLDLILAQIRQWVRGKQRKLNSPSKWGPDLYELYINRWFIESNKGILAVRSNGYTHKEMYIWWIYKQRKVCMIEVINQSAPAKCSCEIKLVILKLISMIDILSISCKIAFRWMPQYLIDDLLKKGQTIAWGHQLINQIPEPLLTTFFVTIQHHMSHWVNSLWHHMVTQIWINIGSGNGLSPEGIKQLPEPMVTYHKYDPVAFIWEQIHDRYLYHQFLISLSKLFVKISLKSPRVQWINYWDHNTQQDWVCFDFVISILPQTEALYPNYIFTMHFFNAKYYPFYTFYWMLNNIFCTESHTTHTTKSSYEMYLLSA